MIVFAVTRQKARILEDLLVHRELGPMLPPARVLTYRQLAGMDRIPRGVWVLTDLDALGRAGRGFATALHRMLSGAGVPVLNDPRRVPGRRALLDALHEEGINDFRAVGADADPDALRYPVFVRSADDHLGPLGGLSGDADAARAAMTRAEALGVPRAELLLTEYVDVRSDDGLYRKYQSYGVGDTLVPCFPLASSTWMVKFSSTELTPRLAREGSEHLRDRPHDDFVRRVLDFAAVEYGRVDYGLGRDGRPRVWEINLCPMLVPPRGSAGDVESAPPDPHWDPLRREYHRLLADAFHGLAERAVTGPDLPAGELAGPGARMLDGLAAPPARRAALDLLRAKHHFLREW